MRGSRRGQFSAAPYVGIIPAHAGLTVFLEVHTWIARDHPRACGAHFGGYIKSFTVLGSSPRMRGSLQVLRLYQVLVGIIPAHAGLTYGRQYDGQAAGIIPAHAGLTPTISRRATRTRDHPRACGAHKSASFLDTGVPGSSPRMRGSPDLLEKFQVALGIIPAHAGLTGDSIHVTKTLRDHPRACGAHRNSFMSTARLPGSSPRMRGSRTFE